MGQRASPSGNISTGMGKNRPKFRMTSSPNSMIICDSGKLFLGYLPHMRTVPAIWGSALPRIIHNRMLWGRLSFGAKEDAASWAFDAGLVSYDPGSNKSYHTEAAMSSLADDRVVSVIFSPPRSLAISRTFSSSDRALTSVYVLESSECFEMQ